MDSSNIAQVAAWLSGLVDSFDFKRHGVEGSLGRHIAQLGAGRTHTRPLHELDESDGKAISELARKN
jgi:hypothetical protein